MQIKFVFHFIYNCCVLLKRNPTHRLGHANFHIVATNAVIVFYNVENNPSFKIRLTICCNFFAENLENEPLMFRAHFTFALEQRHLCATKISSLHCFLTKDKHALLLRRLASLRDYQFLPAFCQTASFVILLFAFLPE